MQRPIGNNLVPGVVGREDLQGRTDGVGLGRAEEDGLGDRRHLRGTDAGQPGRVAADRSAFFAGAAAASPFGRRREIDRRGADRPLDAVNRCRPGRCGCAADAGRPAGHRPRARCRQSTAWVPPFRAGKVPLAHGRQVRRRAVHVRQFVDADLHLVLAGIQREGEIDAGLVARRAFVLDREDQRHLFLRGIEGVELEAGELLPVRDPSLAVAEAIALGKDDLQRLAAQFLALLDGHGRGAVAARVVGDLALADIEQGLLAGDGLVGGAGRQTSSKPATTRAMFRAIILRSPFARCALIEDRPKNNFHPSRRAGVTSVVLLPPRATQVTPATRETILRPIQRRHLPFAAGLNQSSATGIHYTKAPSQVPNALRSLAATWSTVNTAAATNGGAGAACRARCNYRRCGGDDRRTRRTTAPGVTVTGQQA